MDSAWRCRPSVVPPATAATQGLRLAADRRPARAGRMARRMAKSGLGPSPRTPLVLRKTVFED